MPIGRDIFCARLGHSASCIMNTGSFPVVERRRRGADHLPILCFLRHSMGWHLTFIKNNGKKWLNILYDYCNPGCDTVWFGRNSSKFWRRVLPPSPRERAKDGGSGFLPRYRLIFITTQVHTHNKTIIFRAVITITQNLENIFIRTIKST